MGTIANPSLRDFWEPYSPIKLLYGGRDSGKTKDTVLFLATLAANYKVRVMCARQFQNKISQSVYTELKWAIERLCLEPIFTITNNSIICNKTGSEFFFYGIRRNINEIKGTSDVDILYIEEGEDLTKEQWEIIEPTIRKDFSSIFIVFNPNLVTDFVWNNLVMPDRDDIIKRHINFNENTFLSEKSKDRIQRLKETDYDSYLHIYEGQPRMDDNEAVIKRKWIMSCIDAHKILDVDIRGGRQIGFDVADSGEDTNARVLMNGGLVSTLLEWKAGEDELYESAAKVYQYANETMATVIYDSNGVGAGVGSNMKQMNASGLGHVKYYGFDSAASPAEPESLYSIEGVDTQQTNREYFENRKAQAWWILSDRIKATHRAVTLGSHIEKDIIFSIDGEIDGLEKLITELSTPRRKTSGRLKNMVEKKEDMRKRGIASPNIADAIVMAAYPHLIGDYSETASFKMKGL